MKMLLAASLSVLVLAGCATRGGEQPVESRRESPEQRAQREGAREDRQRELQARAREQLAQDPGASLSSLPPARLPRENSNACIAALETMAEHYSGQRVMLGEKAFVDSSELVLDQAFARGADGTLIDGKRLEAKPFVMQLRFGPKGCMAVVPAQSAAVHPVPASRLIPDCRCQAPVDD